METCPKCGFDRQPEHDECPKCGIVYEKYLKVVKHQEEQAKRPGRKPISKKDKIALFTVITFIGLIIAILMFNTIMKNMRIQREREAREREKEKIIETFAVSSEEILNQLESLIDKGKLALAEKRSINSIFLF